MKKLLYFLAAASVMLVACDKTEKTNYTAQLNEPEGRVDHATLLFDKSDAPTVTNPVTAEQDKLEGITFTSGTADPEKGYGDGSTGNTGMMMLENGGPVGMVFSVNAAVSKVRANTVYAVSGVGAFSLESVDGKKVSVGFTDPSGAKSTLKATLAEEPKQTSVMKDACRVWNVVETTVSVKEGTAVPVAGTYTGCNLYGIVASLRDKGVNIKSIGQGYEVMRVIFTEAGNFSILFAAEPAFYGDYKFSGTKFTYDFDYYEDCPVIAEEASGDFSVVNGFGRLELNATLKDNAGKSYEVQTILKLQEEKPFDMSLIRN